MFGYRLTVLVVPGVPGTMPRALYYVRGRAATLSDAAAAMAEPAIDATL